MRRLLAALTAGLAACSSSPTPAPVPAPAPELAILRTRAGGYAFLESRTGKVRAALPAGILALNLSEGGDVAEAYLVSTAAPSGFAIDRVVPDRSFALQRVTAGEGIPAAAVLATAPGLTAFVGRRTVLTVLTADGRTFGYQHGSLLWKGAGATGEQLLGVGDQTLLLDAGGWQRVLTESGSTGPVEAVPSCRPGPVAVVASEAVYDCGGMDPSGRPEALPAGNAALLAYPDGGLWRVDARTGRRIGTGPAWTIRPAVSPDGAHLYVATPDAIERVDSGSGQAARLVTAGGITSVALSRDGNYLYALSAGHLRTYSTGSGNTIATVAAEGQAILQIAGG
jgi:hypothetical protein